MSTFHKLTTNSTISIAKSEKLKKLEEELRDLPEKSETVVSFHLLEFEEAFDWDAYAEWVEKGKPYEEPEEVLMFLNQNGVSNKRSDGKPSECSIFVCK